MDVNSISVQNNISNLNNVNNESLGKISTGSVLNKASDDASSLAISQALEGQRSELAQSLQNINSGVAMTRIAQGGIESQKEILEQINQKTLQAMNGTTSEQGKEAIQNEIGKLLEQFNNISESTTYNDQSLLNNSAGGESLTIATSSDTYSISPTDTSSIPGAIEAAIESFTPDDMQTILKEVQNGTTTLDNFASQFGAVENQLTSSARNTMTEQVNVARANSALTDVDFGAEISDFNKTNVMSQVGYMVASQANAMQENNLRLLT